MPWSKQRWHRTAKRELGFGSAPSFPFWKRLVPKGQEAKCTAPRSQISWERQLSQAMGPQLPPASFLAAQPSPSTRGSAQPSKDDAMVMGLTG